MSLQRASLFSGKINRFALFCNRMVSTYQDERISLAFTTENYTYDQTCGILTNMTSGGDTLKFQYNSLKMPAKRISPKLDMTYSYQVLSSDGKRIANRGDTILYQNKKSGAAQTYKKLKYTYDNLDNITWIRDYNVQSGQTAKDIAKYSKV